MPPLPPDPIAQRSNRLFRLFGFYLRWRFGRHFHAVRLSGIDPATLPAERPVVIFSNHPSWWDPAAFMLLADRCFPGRPGFGPMDEEALGRYGFFRKLGIFGIDKHSAAGARRFLLVARRVLGEASGPGGRAMMWITAEGDFTDPRRRPVRLRPGIAHLAASTPEALLVPLAMEYVFWNESRPEALLRLGTPIDAAQGGRAAEWAPRLERALADTMDALATDAVRRDPALFTTLNDGTAGAGWIYDQWRRLRALGAGRRFDPSHGGRHRTGEHP